MLRSGFLLGVVGPAALTAVLVLPTVRASADKLVVKPVAMPVSVTAPATATTPNMPGFRPASLEISPVHSANVRVATMPRPAAKTQPAAIGQSASERELIKPRRMTREGCEAPLSSLVGPEARRMVPGRCMA